MTNQHKTRADQGNPTAQFNQRIAMTSEGVDLIQLLLSTLNVKVLNCNEARRAMQFPPSAWNVYMMKFHHGRGKSGNNRDLLQVATCFTHLETVRVTGQLRPCVAMASAGLHVT